MPSTVKLFHSWTIHESKISDKFVLILTAFPKIVSLSPDVLAIAGITTLSAEFKRNDGPGFKVCNESKPSTATNEQEGT
jgi:hypothetical protein